jgi:ABC-type phosphate/phosphonate transport system substrate-binding protein
MASPKTDQATIHRLRDSLLSFNETEAGRAFFRKSQFESFLPLDEATMKRIDPYVHVLTEVKR